MTMSEIARSGDVSDEALFQEYQDVLNGKAAERRALQNVAEAQREAEDFWRAAHRRGEPLPRNFEYLEEQEGGSR